MEEANKSELQKATERANALETELKAMKTAEEVRVMREKVANETGIPSNLLTGATEDECKASDKSIQDLTDKYIKDIDNTVAAKSKELMTI